MVHTLEGDPLLLDFSVSDEVWPTRQSDAQLAHEMASCSQSKQEYHHVVGIDHSVVTVVDLVQQQRHVQQVLEVAQTVPWKVCPRAWLNSFHGDVDKGQLKLLALF